MINKILIIPKEDENQTLESVTALPLKVQVSLALYVLNTEELCTLLNVYKNLTNLNDWKKAGSYKAIYEALIDENNFIIPYVSRH